MNIPILKAEQQNKDYYTPQQFKNCLANPKHVFLPHPVVKDDLDLSNNINVIFLPEGLRVRRALNLTGCTNLVFLQKLSVRNLRLINCTTLTFLREVRVKYNLNLSGCTNLIFLSPIRLKGYLNLYGCTNLPFLPPIHVENDVDLTGCSSVAYLSEGLYVGGNLNLTDCINLPFLPQEFHVKGDLNLSGCISLISLPEEKPDIGGDVDLTGCIGLTSLPPWITQLGLRSDGRTRMVYLDGTRLPEDVRNGLMQANAPGMQFHFSQAASSPEQAFGSLKEALAFWKQETKNTNLLLPDVMIDPEHLKDVLQFLGRLTSTAEYNNIHSRPFLAQRIIEAFKLMAENKEIQGRAVNIIYHGLRSCDDGMIFILDEIELMVNIFNLENSIIDEAKLRKLGKSYLMLEMVNKKVDEHIKTLTKVDKVEICLAFQTELADRFNLPGSTRNMIFREHAQIKPEGIQAIGDVIEKEYTEEMLENFLTRWSPWITYQRRIAVPLYEALKSIPSDNKEYECCIGGVPTNKPVQYGSQVYDYDTFVKCYLNSGTDPFTRQPIVLSDLVRLS